MTQKNFISPTTSNEFFNYYVSDVFKADRAT